MVEESELEKIGHHQQGQVAVEQDVIDLYLSKEALDAICSSQSTSPVQAPQSHPLEDELLNENTPLALDNYSPYTLHEEFSDMLVQASSLNKPQEFLPPSPVFMEDDEQSIQEVDQGRLNPQQAVTPYSPVMPDEFISKSPSPTPELLPPLLISDNEFSSEFIDPVMLMVVDARMDPDNFKQWLKNYLTLSKKEKEQEAISIASTTMICRELKSIGFFKHEAPKGTAEYHDEALLNFNVKKFLGMTMQNFEKSTMYFSRKRYAESRPRVSGRFVKQDSVDTGKPNYVTKQSY